VHLQDTIKKQVASMYLWPKTLEVPIMDPSKYSFGHLVRFVLFSISKIPVANGSCILTEHQRGLLEFYL
jgi:hypothetical protein